MMKTYLRLLGFASPLSRYAVPYFFYSVLHALFNTFTYTMIIPIIGTLFSEEIGTAQLIGIVLILGAAVALGFSETKAENKGENTP